MRVEWSDEALADLDRFIEFLNQAYPPLAAKIAAEIISKVQALADNPRLGDRSRVVRNIARSSCRFFAPPTCFNIGSTASAS